MFPYSHCSYNARPSDGLLGSRLHGVVDLAEHLDAAEGRELSEDFAEALVIGLPGLGFRPRLARRS